MKNAIQILVFLTSLLGCTISNAEEKDTTVLFQESNLKVRMHFQAGINAVAENNLFWNFADTFAPSSDFDSDTKWLEGYIKPGVSFEYATTPQTILYGKLSGVGSYTKGVDAYDAENTGRFTLEEAYLGVRHRLTDDAHLDLSIGPRELRLGTGMLVANGGSSGFERGALKFGPRKAWEKAAIGQLSIDQFTGSIFYIDPNEMPSNDNRNALAGIDLRYDFSDGGFVGGTYLHLLQSDSAYPQAPAGGIGPPTVIPGARKGLNALNYYAKTDTIDFGAGKVFFATDLAYEWNSRVNLTAWGGRLQAGYSMPELPWSPSFSYTYQTFSGDNPDTDALERFDPLFFEGSPSAWATGSKSSMVSINSNVHAHGLSFSVKPTPKDTITLRYAHIRANELFSPIQFGQGTRQTFSNNIPAVVSGVSDPHLADDIFLEYNHVFNQNTFFTAGVSLSIPGKGIEGAVGGEAPVWLGGFANVVVNY